MLDALSPQRKRFVIGSIAAAIALALIGTALATRPQGRHPGLAVIPVILVHGYGGSPAYMATLAGALRHEHRQVKAVALPDHGKAEIDRSAGVVARAVERTGAAKVDLVGFSAGSIVVRAYLATGAGAERAHRVVLLGAPNHGAAIASLALSTEPSACVDACQELARHSAYLRALNSHPDPHGIPIVSIWTADDLVVMPPESALLRGATNIEIQRVCAGADVAHGDLVSNPVSVGLTIEALQGRASSRQSCGQVQKLGTAALGS